MGIRQRDIVYGIIHFVFGFIGMKLGLVLPFTAIFMIYESTEAIIELEWLDKFIREFGEVNANTLVENYYQLIRELRRDIATYVAGILLGLV